MAEKIARGFTLLAMPPSGESFLARDPEGTIWLTSVGTPSRSRLASQHDVDLAVSRHDWYVIDEQFDSWEHLDQSRRAKVNQILGKPADVSQYDAMDVRLALQDTEGSELDDALLATDVLVEILARCQVVLEDHDLFREVTERLLELRRGRPMAATTIPPTPGLQRALSRMNYEQAA